MLILILIFNLVINAVAQDCDVGGKLCVDHEQCCGGCCFDGECKDTFRSCQTAGDVCRHHVCYGKESCVVFVPAECSGCEPIPVCKII